MAHIEQFAQVERVDYKGREFANFHVRRNPIGYVVFGHSTGGEYGGNLIHVCATLIKRLADGRAFHAGWKRKRDAQAFADYLNVN